jgi:hypothetical protein
LVGRVDRKLLYDFNVAYSFLKAAAHYKDITVPYSPKLVDTVVAVMRMFQVFPEFLVF